MKPCWDALHRAVLIRCGAKLKLWHHFCVCMCTDHKHPPAGGCASSQYAGHAVQHHGDAVIYILSEKKLMKYIGYECALPNSAIFGNYDVQALQCKHVRQQTDGCSLT